MEVAVGAISNMMSMRSGSKLSASRDRFWRTPSIHIVSELTWKNGSWPSRGSALTTPPPVPRHLVALVGNDDAGGWCVWPCAR